MKNEKKNKILCFNNAKVLEIGIISLNLKHKVKKLSKINDYYLKVKIESHNIFSVHDFVFSIDAMTKTNN